MTARKRFFTGIQPTGEVHLGNYVGAIANAVDLAGSHEAICCIVDYHAMTEAYDPAKIRERILHVAAMWIASGLTPERGTLFVQSAVPAHTELAWILGTVTPMGELSRMTQFKDKSDEQKENVNAGLFTYPVLQAADILLYKAEVVPVGADQAQHLELSREIARHFNRRYGAFFPEPQTLLSPVPKVLGLDGKKKMSKSLGNHIPLADDASAVWKKLSGAVTDENRKRRTDPGNPDVCNVFTMHKFFTDDARRKEIDRDCRSAAIGCVDCKKDLAGRMESRLGPVRTRYEALMKNPAEIEAVLSQGASRARAIAQQTISEVRKILGVVGS